MGDDHEREPVRGTGRVTRRETSRAELVFWLGIGGFVAVPPSRSAPPPPSR